MAPSSSAKAAPAAKPSAKGGKAGLVRKGPLKISAQEVLEQRERVNAQAKANMMLRDVEGENAKLKAFEEPGAALRLLSTAPEDAYLQEAEVQAAKKEPLEYGEWGTEHWPTPDGPGDAEEPAEEPADDAELGEEAVESEAAEADDAEADEAEADEAEAAPEGDGPAEGAEGDAAPAEEEAVDKGKQKGTKGTKGKGKKPWWAQTRWKGKGSNQQGRGGRKGQGKGIFDDWGANTAGVDIALSTASSTRSSAIVLVVCDQNCFLS